MCYTCSILICTCDINGAFDLCNDHSIFCCGQGVARSLRSPYLDASRMISWLITYIIYYCIYTSLYTCILICIRIIYIYIIYIYIYVLIYISMIYIYIACWWGQTAVPQQESARCMPSFRRCAPCSGPRCCSSWSTTCASEIEGLRDGPWGEVLRKFSTEWNDENDGIHRGKRHLYLWGLFSMYKKDKKQRIRGLEPWLKFLAMPALWVQIPKIWATEAEEFWGFAAPRVDSHRSGGWDFESLSWKLAENWDMSWIVMEDSVPLDAWPGLQFSLRTWSTATSRMTEGPMLQKFFGTLQLQGCSVLVMWTSLDVKTKSIWSTIEAVTVWPNLNFFLTSIFIIWVMMSWVMSLPKAVATRNATKVY